MNKTPRKSPYIKLVAIAEDEATREFIAVIKFRDIDGQIRRIEQPRSTLRKIEKLKEALDDAGACLSTMIEKTAPRSGHYRRRSTMPSGGNMRRMSDGMMITGHSSGPVASLADLAVTP